MSGKSWQARTTAGFTGAGQEVHSDGTALGHGDVLVHRSRGVRTSSGRSIPTRCGTPWPATTRAPRGIDAQPGHVVKSTGDGVHAVFTAAADAVPAGTTPCERSPPNRGRRPDHCGFASASTPASRRRARRRYFGLTLNRASRLMSATHGGQVVLSQVSADLVRDLLPEGLELRDLGEHRLRGLARPEQVYELRTPGSRRSSHRCSRSTPFPARSPARTVVRTGRRRTRRSSSELERLEAGGSGRERVQADRAAGRRARYREDASGRGGAARALGIRRRALRALRRGSDRAVPAVRGGAAALHHRVHADDAAPAAPGFEHDSPTCSRSSPAGSRRPPGRGPAILKPSGTGCSKRSRR